MVAERLGRLAARLVNAMEPAAQRVNSSEFAKRLRDEFERGRSGADEAATGPASPDGAHPGVATDATRTTAAGTDTSDTPTDTVDATRSTTTHSTAAAATTDAEIADADETPAASDEDSVVAALRAVDWSKVRTATAERSSTAAQRMREMAADVDWGRVQAGAAVVSSALIAAVASGQVPLGGRLAGPVARAILNDADLGARVNSRLKGDAAPPDLRDAVQRDTATG